MAGYRLGPPLGFGARGPVWSAAALPGGTVATGRACAISVLPAEGRERDELQRRRLAALVGSRHESLAEILAIVPLTAGCAVVSERLDGPTLAVLRASRPALTPGEIGALLRPLAGALERLHSLGLVHGDVSPANVVLAADGRPVLVDLAGDVAFEAGTAGFLAPERALGAPAGPAADVWSLATTVLWLADGADRSRLQDALAPALTSDPVARCTARELAAVAAGFASPGPVTVPMASALAQGSLRAAAAIEETSQAASRRPRPLRRGSGRHRRGRETSSRRRRRAGLVLAAVLVAIGIGHQVIVDRPASSPQLEVPHAPITRSARAATPSADLGGASAAPADAEVIAATRGLVEARDAALNSGDARLLARLSLPDSPAARGDAELVDLLASGATDIAGLETRISHVAVLDMAENAARVELTSQQSAHARTGIAGVVDVPDQPERCAVLSLASVEGRWVLGEVSECEPAPRG